MLTLFSIIIIGFFLGMRPPTDPDHVIAVSTIVSQQPNTKRAALIGAVWGVGHTDTIFAVGTAIILFNLVIPARLGLGLELSVGLMLIALGGWNLAAFLRSMPAASPVQGEKPLLHSHAHNHGEHSHVHLHAHAGEQHHYPAQPVPLASVDEYV